MLPAAAKIYCDSYYFDINVLVFNADDRDNLKKKLMKGVYSPVKRKSASIVRKKLEQLASAEERNRESFNPDVDLGPEPVTEKNQQRNQKKTADIVQFDNVDKKRIQRS